MNVCFVNYCSVVKRTVLWLYANSFLTRFGSNVTMEKHHSVHVYVLL